MRACVGVVLRACVGVVLRACVGVVLRVCVGVVLRVRAGVIVGRAVARERVEGCLVDFVCLGDVLAQVELAGVLVELGQCVDDVAVLGLIVDRELADHVAVLVEVFNVGDAVAPGVDGHVDVVGQREVDTVEPVRDVDIGLRPIGRRHLDLTAAIDGERGVGLGGLGGRRPHGDAGAADRVDRHRDWRLARAAVPRPWRCAERLHDRAVDGHRHPLAGQDRAEGRSRHDALGQDHRGIGRVVGLAIDGDVEADTGLGVR
ncbi:unannotated protein [freshwater metagenome]|uniref:Unannotated protein n=1 Tax=freshwater metagenome TaxID=449393 RepID=A0A6J7L9Q1_9ZZZZ